MPERRLELRVVPSAELEGARVGIVRVDVVPVGQSTAGANGSSEEEGNRALTVAREVPPVLGVVGGSVHD